MSAAERKCINYGKCKTAVSLSKYICVPFEEENLVKPKCGDGATVENDMCICPASLPYVKSNDLDGCTTECGASEPRNDK